MWRRHTQPGQRGAAAVHHGEATVLAGLAAVIQHKGLHVGEKGRHTATESSPEPDKNLLHQPWSGASKWLAVKQIALR